MKSRTLQYALLVSIAVHAVLLTLRFAAPETMARIFRDTPLEVILVNTRSENEDDPDKPQAIAQTKLQGGGEASEGRTASPLPATQINLEGETLEEETRRRIRELQSQQQLLLAQVREQLQQLSRPPSPSPQQPEPSKDTQAQEEKRRLLMKQLAEIERFIKEENARPRKRYIGPSTREAAYAIYYDRLRRQIEAKGTANFPVASDGRKLYGELTMVVTIDARGYVVATEVAESSGNHQLDRRAEAIARAAGPFGSFTDAMRRQADLLVVVSRFRFSCNDTLETRMTAPGPAVTGAGN